MTIQHIEVLVALISGTHLASKDSFTHPDFRTYLLDRNDGRRCGGVAVVVRKGLIHRLLPCPRTRVIEALAIELHLANRQLIVVSAYFPGSSDPLVLSTFRKDLEVLSDLGPNLLIGGDFNSRYPF